MDDEQIIEDDVDITILNMILEEFERHDLL